MTQYVGKSAMVDSIQEVYCSYEVSQLLKEKGFLKGVDLRLTPNLAFYDNIGLRYNVAKWYDSLIQDKIDFTVAPTHQMAMKWLREMHKVFIEVSVSIDLNGDYHYSYFILDKRCKYIRKGFTDFDWNYEEAVEAALKYSLENLL